MIRVQLATLLYQYCTILHMMTKAQQCAFANSARKDRDNWKQNIIAHETVMVQSQNSVICA